MTTRSERIVIVDDERRMCDSLSALLIGDGYAVKTFQDSTVAAETIRRGKVDLVIADIKMPKLDGLQILKIVKEIDQSIPVILMTGFASIDSALEAISNGAYDYLLKPVEFTQLELAVNRALEKRRADQSRAALLEELKVSNLRLQRRVKELKALYEAGKSIGSAANLKELLRQIVTLATNVTEAKVGSIMLLAEDEDYLTIEAAIGLDRKIMDKTRLSMGQSIAGYVAKTGEPLVVADVEKDDRFKRINKERYGAASLLCVPLIIKNQVIGVINLANKQSGAIFSVHDLQLLTTFASQAAVAVDDANQFEKNRRRLAEFEILRQMADEMAGIRSMNQFRGVLLDKLKRVFPIDFSIWFHYDRGHNTLVADGASGIDNIPLTNSGGIDLHRIDRDQIKLNSVDLSLPDCENIRPLTDSVVKALSNHAQFPKPSAANMAIPILKYGELAYICYLGARSEKQYSPEDISLARLVISQSALLFERERSLLNATRLLTMGNMISEISHDLRKPLTSLRGGLQVVRKKWPEIAEQSEFFVSSEEEVRRMNELVRELVDFSNPNKYQTEKVDIRRIVERAAELVGQDLKKYQVSFDAKFDHADWEVIINKNQVLEVLLNIYINAIQAMPDGGQLCVYGLVERPDHKKIDFLALRISDTGHGIKKENLSRIFGRYFTTKDSGTGLGLAVVERIMSAHNGTHTVESTVGKGTTFTLYFPYGS